jgi:metacaspase-1
MTTKITYQELEKLVLEHGASSSLVKQYFKELPDSDAPFSPNVVIDETLVKLPQLGPGTDLQGPARNAALMNAANGLSKLSRQVEYGKNTRKFPDRQRIVSEGDSWTQFPILLKDIVDNLMDSFNVFSLDEAGDTVKRMLDKAEFEKHLQDKLPSVFLFSGGGNDIVGDRGKPNRLARHLRPFDPNRTAEEHILPTFDTTVIAGISKEYRRMINMAKANGPANMKICVHGYDYATPGAGNDWISRNMQEAGINDRNFQWQIVRGLIDRFNVMLADLARSESRLMYVDLRGNVAPKTASYARALPAWHDELHPKDRGFKAAADKIAQAIKASGAA